MQAPAAAAAAADAACKIGDDDEGPEGAENQGSDDEGEQEIESHFTLSNLASVYDASDVFDGAVEEIDEEGEGGEEVERRAYADVRQLEAAAVATRRLAGKRTLKALPPVPVAKGTEREVAGNADRGASGGAAGARACDVLLPGGGGAVGDRLPLNTSAENTPKQKGGGSPVSLHYSYSRHPPATTVVRLEEEWLLTDCVRGKLSGLWSEGILRGLCGAADRDLRDLGGGEG